MPKLKPDFSAMAERARHAARGSHPPAGVDPAALAEPGPDGRHRRAIRQRLRRTRSVRRARVSELGLLVAEMQARGRWNSDLVDEWVRELDRDGAELRGLEQALCGDVQLDDLVALRVVAECGACGRIGGAGDNFCAGCGRELPAGAPARRKETAAGNTLAGDLTTIQPPA
jgi:hypothetical protein